MPHSVRRVLEPDGADGAATRPRAGVLAVVSWAGMRGVVSLALALSLPHTAADGQPFLERVLVVFVTFGVVLVTLVGQGLTLPALIRRLGVGATAGGAEAQELAAGLRMARAALRRLDAIGVELGAAPDALERVRGLCADRVELLEGRQERQPTTSPPGDTMPTRAARLHEETRRLLARLHEIEHVELQAVVADTDVDAPVARRLQDSLDAFRVRDGR